MTRLVCVGHSTIDTIYQVAAIPSTPTKVSANAYSEAGGGIAANASVAAARLGGIVHYWGRVGDDALGERIVALLEAEGVQTAVVRRIAGARSPCTAVLVDDRGRDWSAPTAIPHSTRMRRGCRLPRSSTSTSWPTCAGLRVRRAPWQRRAAGVPAVLDGDVAAVATLRELCRCCDYAIFSQAGLNLASGAVAVGEGLRRMQEIAGGMVGVTLGTRFGGRLRAPVRAEVEALLSSA